MQLDDEYEKAIRLAKEKKRKQEEQERELEKNTVKFELWLKRKEMKDTACTLLDSIDPPRKDVEVSIALTSANANSYLHTCIPCIGCRRA
jgi:hypothetical protein